MGLDLYGKISWIFLLQRFTAAFSFSSCAYDTLLTLYRVQMGVQLKACFRGRRFSEFIIQRRGEFYSDL